MEGKVPHIGQSRDNLLIAQEEGGPEATPSASPKMKRDKPKKLRKKTQPTRSAAPKENFADLSDDRRQWLSIVNFLNFYIPDKLLEVAGIKKEAMLAWREKYALCSLVAIVSAIFMFWLVGLDGLLCPAIPVNGLDMQIVRDSKNLVAMNGKVISLDIQDPEVKKLVDEDATMREFVKLLSSHQGKDITSLFPSYQFLAIKGTETTGVFQDPVIDKCIRSGSSGNRIRSALRFLTIWARNYGYRLNNGAIAQCPVPLGPNERPSDPPKTTACVGFSKKFQTFLKKQHVSELQIYRTEVKKDLVDDKLLDYIVIDNKVYDVSSFARIAALPVIDSNGERTTNIYEPLLDGLVNFFPDDVAKTIVNNIGFDATAAFKRIPGYQNYIPCLDRLFYAGITTDQVSDVCTFGQPLLLATAVCIYAVVGFKLILSLNFFNCCYAPGEIEKTDCVVCFVPCYTEGKDSLEKTIHSLAHANYPDNQKLIFVVCDGNLTGRGNDKSTPVYVLEILGYMGSDPEFVSYQSLGHTGPEQHNRAKVYAGWFKFDHREVPYIVVVKEGQAYEKNKPGNRGKRDSQLILMNFFSKLLQERALLTALEFDLYKKIKDTTKIEPSDYQFTLMVDADTKVDVNSLDVIIRHFKKPKSKVVALCGETRIENKWQSFITMIQVHEYYISHHLGKGFESTFGTVTCLPGCFCAYRFKMPDGTPILSDETLIKEYSETKVDTLHLKNLFHLGEDRYLTSLMLERFPEKRMEYVDRAICYTIIPDEFAVLLSQRRRWINSTFHNLFELVRAKNKLCGTFICSMRLLVGLDFLSAMVTPVSLSYFYFVVLRSMILGAFADSLILFIGFLGLFGTHLVIIFLRKEFEFVMWMLIYIVFSMPIFSIVLPLYAFWHMDDFGWGTTRRSKAVNEEDLAFDEKSQFPSHVYIPEAFNANELKSMRQNEQLGPEAIPKATLLDWLRGEGRPLPLKSARMAAEVSKDSPTGNSRVV